MDEFLVSIGYTLDDKGQERFLKSIEAVGRAATKVGEGLALLASAMAKMLSEVTTSLESAEYAAQRVNSSVLSIMAFTYAMEGVGISSKDTARTLEEIALKVRLLPAASSLVERLGVRREDAGKLRDSVDVLLDIVESLGNERDYVVAYKTASMIGISEREFYQMSKSLPRLRSMVEEARGRQSGFGLSDITVGPTGIVIKQAWRTISAQIDLLLVSMAAKLSETITPMIEWIQAWVRDNRDSIIAFIEKAIRLVIAIASNLADALSTIVRGTEPVLRLVSASDAFVDAFKIFTIVFITSLVAQLAARGKVISAAVISMALGIAAATRSSRDYSGMSGSDPSRKPNEPAQGGYGANSGYSGSGYSGASAPPKELEPTGLLDRFGKAAKKAFRSVFGGGSGGGSGDIDRSSFKEELSNPAVAKRLMALTEAEVGSQGSDAQKAFMETIFNRAKARNKSLWDTMQGSYFPSITHQRVASYMGRQDLDKKYSDMIDDVVGGSNISDYATGNASGTVGFGRNGYRTYSSNGENFGVESPDIGWAERARKQTLMNNSMNKTINKSTVITVDSDTNPNQTAREVSRAQRRINDQMLRSVYDETP